MFWIKRWGTSALVSWLWVVRQVVLDCRSAETGPVLRSLRWEIVFLLKALLKAGFCFCFFARWVWDWSVSFVSLLSSLFHFLCSLFVFYVLCCFEYRPRLAALTWNVPRRRGGGIVTLCRPLWSWPLWRRCSPSDSTCALRPITSSLTSPSSATLWYRKQTVHLL